MRIIQQGINICIVLLAGCTMQSCIAYQAVSRTMPLEKQIEEEYYPTMQEVALVKEGESLLRVGKYKEASISFDKALEYAPHNLEAWAGKCAVFAEMKKYEQTLACYDKMIAANSAHEDIQQYAWSRKCLLLDRLEREEFSLVCDDRTIVL